MAVTFSCDYCGEVYERLQFTTRQADMIAEKGSSDGSFMLACKACEEHMRDWSQREKELIASFRQKQKERENEFVTFMAEKRLEWMRSRRGLPSGEKASAATSQAGQSDPPRSTRAPRRGTPKVGTIAADQ